MTRTCHLHLGLHKTGSSAIQAALHGYDDGRTRYGGFETPNHSAPMTLLFGRDGARVPAVRRKGLGEAALKRRRKRARKALRRDLAETDRNLVISGEGLTTNLKPREVKRLVARLRKRFDAVKAIAYVRPPISMANSAFQQRVKGEGLAEFKPPLPRYRRRLKPWIKHLGRENVEIALYDRARLRGGDVIEDFCARLGLDAGAAKRNSRNESLSADAVAFLFCHNRINGRRTGSPADSRARRRLIQRLAEVGAGRFSFSAAALARAEGAKRGSSLAWMERVAGFSLGDAVPEGAAIFDDAEALLAHAGRRADLLEPLVPEAALAEAPGAGPERCAALMKALENVCYSEIETRSPEAAAR